MIKEEEEEDATAIAVAQEEVMATADEGTEVQPWRFTFVVVM